MSLIPHPRAWRRAGLLAGFLLAAAWAGAAGEPAQSTPPPAAVHLTILHINDSHGHIESFGEGGQLVGGYYRLATLIDQVREARPGERVFFIHAGDEFSRGDALTQSTRGAANLTIWNHLKLDLWVPGNGDFYDGLAALQERMRLARFKVLAANVTLKAGGKPLAENYTIESAGPVKVAFLGLCFVHTDLPSGQDLQVEDPLVTARRLVPELRRQADVVVAVTHLGASKDFLLAASVEGLDVIIGAHTHTVMKTGMRVKGPSGKEVLVAQAGEYLKFLGKVDLTLQMRDGRWGLSTSTAELLPVTAKVQVDPVVKGLVARLAEAAGKSAPKAAAQSEAKTTTEPATVP